MTTTGAAEPRARVSAIVPVYNEERTVARVVATLLSSPEIDEVICVDDGSTDASAAALRSFGPAIELLELAENRGKGAALAAGIRAARGAIVAFVDADLTNLSHDHVATLLAPMHGGEVQAVLAYGTGDTTASQWLSPWIGARFTGERAYLRADLLPHLERMATTRFGVEVFLNRLYPPQATTVVRLEGLVGLGKEAKHPPAVTAREYVGEAMEVARELVRTVRLAPAKSGPDPEKRIEEASDLGQDDAAISRADVRSTRLAAWGGRLHRLPRAPGVPPEAGGQTSP